MSRHSSAIAAAAFMCAMALVMAHSVALANDDKDDFLKAHNRARHDARLPKVEWDHGLEKHARDYAAHCDYRNGVMPYGMNLLWSSHIHDAAGAVDSWVGEKTYYNCHNGKCYAPHGKTCDHYTQIVSERTRRIGCARNVCHGHHGSPTNYYFVCKYDNTGGRPYQCH